MSSRRWTIALCAWSLLVWTTRIGNIWNDADLSDGEKWGRTGLALSFTVLALATLAIRRAWIVQVLAAWTVAVWLTRSFGIATGDHEAAFVTVHLVLAVVSIGLAIQAVREQRQPAASDPTLV